MRRRLLSRIRIGMIAVALAVSTACGGSSGGDAPNPNATPRQGGDVTMLLSGDVRGLSPYTANITPQGDGSRLSALYDVLVWADPATGTVRPQMAESLVPDAEARVWTLTLRDGIRFTDGAQLDADAVKRAWEKHLDPKLQFNQRGTVSPLTLTVLHKLRLSIKLWAPNANFDRTVAHSLNYIPSPRTLDSDETLAASRTAPVGAGPYRLRAWIPGDHIMFTVNVVAVAIPEMSKRVLLDLDYDMATNILWAEDPEPVLYQYMHSKSGLTNVTGYQNPKVDAALEAARVSSDRTVRTEAYTRVQVALIKDVPFFVYQEAPVGYIANPKVAGFQLFSDGQILWDRVGLRA